MNNYIKHNFFFDGHNFFIYVLFWIICSTWETKIGEPQLTEIVKLFNQSKKLFVTRERSN